MFTEDPKDMFDFFQRQGALPAGFDAAGVADCEWAGRVVLAQVQFDAMTKQLLHVHQGVIGDGGAVAALDALQDGPDIPWGDVGNWVEADHRVNFFLIDALGDVGVFQAPGQIGFMPVLEEVFDGADVGLDNFGPFLEWVGARSNALLG